MEEIIIAIDPGQQTVYFAFYVFFSVTMGIIAYVLMRYPSARRPQFRNGKVFSPHVSLLVALLIAIPITLISYRDSWSYFYTVGKEDTALVIEYLFPGQLERAEITDALQITTTTHFLKSGIKKRIIITDGEKQYVSQWMHRSEAEHNFELLLNSIDR